MINPNHPQTRQEMIEYMKPERTATDGQWAVIKYGGTLVLGVALALGISDAVRDNNSSPETYCPSEVNPQDMPECK